MFGSVDTHVMDSKVLATLTQIISTWWWWWWWCRTVRDEALERKTINVFIPHFILLNCSIVHLNVLNMFSYKPQTWIQGSHNPDQSIVQSIVDNDCIFFIKMKTFKNHFKVTGLTNRANVYSLYTFPWLSRDLFISILNLKVSLNCYVQLTLK